MFRLDLYELACLFLYFYPINQHQNILTYKMINRFKNLLIQKKVFSKPLQLHCLGRNFIF